jgi:hypothetical protein
MKKLFLWKTLIGVVWAGLLVGSPMQILAEDEKPKVEFSGFGFLMFGQLKAGYIDDNMSSTTPKTRHLWQNFAEVDLIATSKMSNWCTTKIGFKMTNLYPLGTTNMQKASFFMKFAPSVVMAEGIFNWDLNFMDLTVESGVFQYNFNPDIKILGNYLYRGTAYPLYLENKLDYPWADMMGARVEMAFLDKKLKTEVLLNTKYDHPPWYDWNLGLTTSYNFANIVEFGAGICFDHLLSVNDFETEGRHLAINIREIDSVAHDTSYYTYRSTKLDARLTFDPKNIFGGNAIFGKEDGKIYAELGIVGLEDYKYFEKDPEPSLAHRMPFMVGFNVPCFKVLDLLSAEFEIFNSPWPNKWSGNDNFGPRPKSVNDSTLLNNYLYDDNVKWGVYLKKRIANFQVSAFAANDHYIYITFDQENRPCFEQSLRKPGDWHWYIKLQYFL